MKVLLINGSCHEKGCTYTALSEAARVLNDEGIETEIFNIGSDAIKDCIGCGACEHLCPSNPLSAIYVEGYQVHRIN